MPVRHSLVAAALVTAALALPASASHVGPYCAFHPVCDTLSEVLHDAHETVCRPAHCP